MTASLPRCAARSPIVASPVLTSALASCTKTEIHSFVDPEFRGHWYEKLVISVDTEQLDQRDEAESGFVKVLAEHGVPCQRALDLVPPTREATDEQFKQAVVDCGADAVLTVRMTEYYEDEFYVPPSSSTYTTGSASATTYYHRNRATTYGTGYSSSHTTTTGGYTYTKPRVRHEVQLWDVKTGKSAWIGGAFTAGGARAAYKDLMTSLAKKVVETLKEEGLVRRLEMD